MRVDQLYLINIGKKKTVTVGWVLILFTVVITNRKLRFTHAKERNPRAGRLYLKPPNLSVSIGLNCIAFWHDMPQISFLIICVLSLI